MARDDNAVATVVTVASKTTRQSKSGKPYITLKDAAGEFYNVWDTMVSDRIEQGQTYTLMVSTTESGGNKFNNVVGIGVDAGSDDVDFMDLMPGSTIVAPLATSPRPVPIPKPDPKQYIQDPMIAVRITALTCANELLAHERITQKAMIEVLRKYEKYIVKGIPPEQESSSTDGGPEDLTGFVIHE